jgi:hypothetical protein
MQVQALRTSLGGTWSRKNLWPCSAKRVPKIFEMVEVGSDLGDRQITASSDGHDVTLELGRELLRHGEHPSVAPSATHGMSTERAADPTGAPKLQ